MAKYVVISFTKIKHRNIIIKCIEKYFKNHGLVLIHTLKRGREPETIVFKLPHNAKKFNDTLRQHANKGICRYNIKEKRDRRVISEMTPTLIRMGESVPDILKIFQLN